jgi:hypothetical protein
MPLQPGSDAIVGGTVLRIPAIQSPNYVPGVSGWIIRQDGSAEFTAGTFRGSIEVGSLTGQHFIVNNTTTGDVIDVYNSANKLIFSIDSTGRLVSVSSAGTAEVVINGGTVFLEDTAQTARLFPSVNGNITADQTLLSLTSGVPANAAGGVQASFLEVIAGDAQSGGWVSAGQRGVQGAVVQTDHISNANQLIHVEHYSLTSDAGGNATFNHNCNFTPLMGFLMCVFTAAANGFYESAWFNAPFTSTTAHAHFNSNTGANVANTAIEFYGLFFG